MGAATEKVGLAKTKIGDHVPVNDPMTSNAGAGTDGKRRLDLGNVRLVARGKLAHGLLVELL